MSTLLNPGKNTIQFNKASQGMHEAVSGLSSEQRSYFENHLEVMYRVYPDNTRDIITVDQNYDISGAGYISQQQYQVATCECISNMNNELNLNNGLGGNLVYWYWQTVILNYSENAPSDPEDVEYNNDICEWDGLTPDHYPLSVYDSNGENIAYCWDINQGEIQPNAQLQKGQVYNFVINQPGIINIPEAYQVQETDETYSECMGYSEYCSEYFEDFGVCPDSLQEGEENILTGGCMYNQTVISSGPSSTNQYVMEQGALYEVYMKSDMEPFFLFHGFDDSSTLAAYGYYYDLVGGMNRRGSRCNCCGCSYTGSNSSGSPAEECCARIHGGIAAEYIVELNSACDRDSHVWPDMNGYNCFRISSPPGYNLCGPDINQYTGGFNPVYCLPDETCLVLPNIEEQGQCVEGWDGLIYPLGETPATPENTSCPDGTVPIQGDELSSFPGAQQWVDDYNASWGNIVIGHVPGCCYQPPPEASMNYVCQSDDAISNFESNYENTGVGFISDYDTFIRPVGIDGSSYDWNNYNWTNVQGEDIYSPSHNPEAGEQIDPRKLCKWIHSYVKNSNDQFGSWPSYIAENVPDYSNIAAVEDAQVGLNQPNLTKFQCYYADIIDGCKIPTACNYNDSAELHNDAMCSFERDCYGNCRKNLDGSHNNFAYWGLDECGLCSTTHPNYADSPVADEFYAGDCGECRADERINIASSYLGQIGLSDTYSETIWFHERNSAPYSLYDGDAICYANSEKSCVSIEVELIGGEWYLINDIPQSYNSSGTSWTHHNINNFLITIENSGFQTNGCEVDWQLLASEAEAGNVFSGINYLPFKQIRAACGLPPHFNTTQPGENWTFGIVSTNYSGTITDLLKKRSELIGDPVANDDNVTDYFVSPKPVDNIPYGSQFWGLIPFQYIGIESDIPVQQPYDIAITEVIDGTDYDNRVFVANPEGDLSNPNFTFEIGKPYHFRIHINPTGIDATPGIFGDAFQFTALGNNISYYDSVTQNLMLNSLSKVICCEDTNGNNICDIPLQMDTYCLSTMSPDVGIPPLYDTITHCGALEVNNIVHHTTYGDVNGCMDPTAINYNPEATNEVPEGICSYTVPFQFNHEAGNLGSNVTPTPPPSSEMHLETRKYKKETQEDVESINTFITFWDYNFSTHQQVWTINDIDVNITTQNIITNSITQLEEQGILKNFSIRSEMGNNGLEHFGSIGSRTYNGVGYSEVQKYRLHLNYTPSNDVTGDFDNLSRIEIKHPYHNVYSELYWQLILVAKNDYPKIKTYGPNLLKKSQVDIETEQGWSMYMNTNIHDTITTDKVVPGTLDGPGFSNNDEFKTVPWFKNHQLNHGGALQDTPKENIISHAMVHNLGSILRFPHRVENAGDNDAAANIQVYTNASLGEDNYVVSCWIKYLSGNIPDDAGDDLVRLRVRRHLYPYTSYSTLNLIPALRSSRDNGGNWKRIEDTVSWHNVGYKVTTVATSYDTLNEFEYAGTPKFCIEGLSGPECTYPVLPVSELILYKNILMYRSDVGWYKTSDEIQPLRFSFESAGNTFEDGTNIAIGVYGAQIERDEDYVNYSAATNEQGLTFQEGKRFTDKVNDEYFLPAGPQAADTEHSNTEWDNTPECNPRVSYKFTTIKDKRYLSEELSEASQGYIFRELETWKGYGESLQIMYNNWYYEDLSMYNDFEDEEYSLLDSHTVLIQQDDIYEHECTPWVGGYSVYPSDDEIGGGAGTTPPIDQGQLGDIAQSDLDTGAVGETGGSSGGNT
tara:strand:- start:24615 stop:29864 length:5250 start_codon:yes stop_codon:yes gene_type:complete